ncbi:hypothetical protein GWI33_018537 [Rhynchophorus ferrugineus]|uniref:Uncharacterized protein n=1 Tax=Rhynchophorus ferrugineus TaxID=354439 RepID=A0A834HVN9_RHYFE|nr:hypothetical protein GWI33_018537 [Rhynchophorus ferrugineus]
MSLLRHHLQVGVALLASAISLTAAANRNSSVALVRKCCPLGEEYLNKTCIISSVEFNLSVEFPIEYTFGSQCPRGKVHILVDPANDPENVRFRPLPTGQLEVYGNETSIMFDTDSYCIDYINLERSDVSALLCVPMDEISPSIFSGKTHYPPSNYTIVGMTRNYRYIFSNISFSKSLTLPQT